MSAEADMHRFLHEAKYRPLRFTESHRFPGNVVLLAMAQSAGWVRKNELGFLVLTEAGLAEHARSPRVLGVGARG